jgi:hypothetical protein
MPLRRFQPISRAGQWRDVIVSVDPRTGEAADLSQATLVMGLFPTGRGHFGRDYGRWFGFDCLRPVLTAQTTPANDGIFRILSNQHAAEFAFPQEMVGRLCSGSYLLLVSATVAGRTDEIVRETIVVLDGGGPVLPLPVLPTTTLGVST